MAVSAQFNFQPTVDQILRSALQYAGLLPLGREPSATQLVHARDMMDMFFKSMSSDGAALWELEQAAPLVTEAGTATYTLAADTINVEFPMMCAAPGATSQTQVTQMVFANYQEIADKAQQGTPIRGYCERLSDVTLTLWPVPDKAYTISYRRQRLMRNAEAGTTVDRPPRWMRGIAFQMAHDMALSGSLAMERVKYLQGMAEKMLSKAHGRDSENGEISYYLERS
jgi:hypothetical protein